MVWKLSYWTCWTGFLFSFTVKPGMCPMVQPGTGGVCVEECMNDTQCMGNKKCCSNGCGHTCREPESRTEGLSFFLEKYPYSFTHLLKHAFVHWNSDNLVFPVNYCKNLLEAWSFVWVSGFVRYGTAALKTYLHFNHCASKDLIMHRM